MAEGSEKENREYAAVDFAKFFFCICILFLHTGAYHEVPYEKFVLYDILRLAVPFFFVSSGYFFGCKLWKEDHISAYDKWIGYEKRLLYPYLAFTAINTLLSAYDLYCAGESLKWTILRLVRAAIFYPNGALWYVWASMTGMAIVFFFRESKKDKIGLYPGPDLLLRGVAGEQLLLFIKWDAASKRRRFVFAYCCFHQKWIICRISAFIDRSYNIKI